MSDGVLCARRASYAADDYSPCTERDVTKNLRDCCICIIAVYILRRNVTASLTSYLFFKLVLLLSRLPCAFCVEYYFKKNAQKTNGALINPKQYVVFAHAILILHFTHFFLFMLRSIFFVIYNADCLITIYTYTINSNATLFLINFTHANRYESGHFSCVTGT